MYWYLFWKKFYCYKCLFHAYIPCLCLSHCLYRYCTCKHIIYLAGDTYVVNYLIHEFMFHCMSWFGLATDSHTLSNYVSLGIGTVENIYSFIKCSIDIRDLTVLRVFCAIFHQFADPFSLFVKLNVAYNLAIFELLFLLFSILTTDFDFKEVFVYTLKF